MHEAATAMYIIHTVPAVLDSQDDVGIRLERVSDRVERICSYMNTQVHATAAMSLPALLVGTGEDPGGGGGPVNAVFGSEAREYSG